jgi:hypothetical protein
MREHHSRITTAEQPSIADLIQQLERISRPGTRLFVISDFHDLLDEDYLAPLRRLARKTQVVAISVADALEAELASRGLLLCHRWR